MTDEELHIYARQIAAHLVEPDKKHLRFNDIIQTAKQFYAPDVESGVRELVQACDKTNGSLYDKTTMWASLQQNYGWMVK